MPSADNHGITSFVQNVWVWFHDIELKNISYALTLFSASNRIAPFVRGISMSSAFVDADLDQVAKDLGWKPVPSGANFLLLKPLDEFILRGTRTSKDWTGTVVGDLQLYLDLASHKTRGQEAADFLFEQKILPRWKATLGETG